MSHATHGRKQLGVCVLLGLFILIGVTAHALQSDPFEPNDSLEDAVQIELPFEASSLEITPDDRDLFAFELNERALVSADVDTQNAASALDATLTLLNDAGDEVAFNDDFDGLDPGLRETLDPGRYVIQVQPFINSTGAYTLTVQTEAPEPGEPNDTLGQATPVELPYEQADLNISEVDRDHFAFELSERARVQIDAEIADDDLRRDIGLALLDAQGREIAVNDVDPAGPDLVRTVGPGRYVALVVAFFGDGSYGLSIEALAPEFGEPNESIRAAAPVELPFEGTDLWISTRDRDVFSFELPERAFVLIDVTAEAIGSPLDSTMTLLDAEGDEIVGNDNADGRDPGLGRRLDPGRYFVAIGSIDGASSGAYQLSLRTDEPDACQSRTIREGDRELWALGTLSPGAEPTLVLQGPPDADFDLFILEVLSERPMVTAVTRRAVGLSSEALISFRVRGDRPRPFQAAISAFENGGTYTLCRF